MPEALLKALRSLRRPAVAAIVLITLGGAAWRGLEAASPDLHQSADEEAYGHLAHNLATGLSYGGSGMRDPFHWPPGAPVYFSIAQRIDPQHSHISHNDVPAAYPLQAIAATAIVPLAAAFAWGAGGPLAGVIGAAVTAFYPPLARSPDDLLAEPLGGLLLAAALLMLARGVRRRSGLVVVLAGFVLGLALLTRADLTILPLVLAVVAGVAFARRAGWRAGTGAALLLIGGTLIPTAPWSAFVSARSGYLVPISTGGGSNLFIGTYLPGDGTVFGLKKHVAARTKREYPMLRHVRPANIEERFILHTVSGRPRGAATDKALRSKAFAQLGHALAHRPGALFAMFGRKIWRLWGNYTVGGRQLHESWLRILHLVLVCLAAAGLLFALVRRRTPELAITVALVLTVTAVNAVLVSEPRHALTSLPLLFAAGAAGWTSLWRGPRREPAPAVPPSPSPATTRASAPSP